MQYAVSIRRDGQAVHVTLTARDDYGAIELYERLVDGAKKGSFSLNAGVATND